LLSKLPLTQKVDILTKVSEALTELHMTNPKKTSSCNPVNVVVIAVLRGYRSFRGNENKLIKKTVFKLMTKSWQGLYGGGEGGGGLGGGSFYNQEPLILTQFTNRKK
jgi:hypothetical protein